ncbi:hypothetical protein [Streptomyces sp. sk2.1]|uniref:hypothetical protein n=1 Tax=Streptomyces sp. sk2.1 TaxID=2478959 RepID=UPI0011E69209|nr:hypothetical protein [Streptomyces sp. sk2.1]TXS78199.1 hypothetical protein EAO76_07175 [Streptomyces sp. sk2.1]
MGWTVLYIAFGIVALWLLGEVLLQYKARLRWRLLAFAGFACVVVGVLIPSVLVIVLGTIAFATGQTQVTLSFRRGFSTGWAIGGNPGVSRRRRGGNGDGRQGRGPTLQVSDLELEHDGRTPPPPAEAPAVYEPEPMPDDTGQYGVYSDGHRAGQDGRSASLPQQPPHAPYDPYAEPTTAYGAPGQDAYAAQDPLAGQYDYGTQQQYAAYSDPYIGTGTAGGPAGYPSYDGYNNGNDYDSFGGQQQYAPDPYAQQPYMEETFGSWYVSGGIRALAQAVHERCLARRVEFVLGCEVAPPNGYNNGSGYDEQQYRY